MIDVLEELLRKDPSTYSKEVRMKRLTALDLVRWIGKGVLGAKKRFNDAIW